MLALKGRDMVGGVVRRRPRRTGGWVSAWDQRLGSALGISAWDQRLGSALGISPGHHPMAALDAPSAS
jgi:hypothetical protein